MQNDAASPQFLWQLIIVLTAVGNLVTMAVTIFTSTRRSPPLDKELSEYVRKVDCTRMMERQDNKRGEIYSTFNTRLAEGDREFRDLQRAIGRIEATSEATSKSVAAVNDRLDAFTAEVNSRFESLSTRVDTVLEQIS